jgi:NAD(P)-dependent dehydrogenase (short-subunit alcohol dehydrogenase family)
MTELPSLDGRQVFITGANGFVGRALADRCRGLGADVMGLDTGCRIWSVASWRATSPIRPRGRGCCTAAT